MKQIGIRGAAHGRVAKTTIPDTPAPCPRDKVNWVLRAQAPNLLCRFVDTAYHLPGNRSAIVTTCRRGRAFGIALGPMTVNALLYVAFVIDKFAERIVGWGAHGPPKTDFVLPSRALLRNTLPGNGCLGAGIARSTVSPEKRLVHHSNRGGQCLSIRYTERLAKAQCDVLDMVA